MGTVATAALDGQPTASGTSGKSEAGAQTSAGTGRVQPRRTGPVWTRARLARVMRLRFGQTTQGGVDTRAAAAALGVSQRTVQRWLHTSSGRAKAPIPPARLQQLTALLMPRESTLRTEEHAEVYARRAIKQLELPRKMGVLPAWKEQGWVQPHMVAVLGIAKAGVRQLTVARGTLDRTELLQRRGRVLDFVVVPSRFHATVLIHAALQQVGPWRFQAKRGDVQQGFTWAWLDDAPAVDLHALASRLELR